MSPANLPVYQILDIIKLTRNQSFIQTKNKSCHVLSCRIKGESSFFFNDKEYLAKTGDVLYIPTATTYCQQTESETVIAFHLSISGDSSPSWACISTPDSAKTCDLFLKAYSIWKTKPQNYEYLCMSILYEIIAFSNASIINNVKTSIPPLLQNAINLLDSMLYDKDLSLNNICKRSYISRTYFNRLFVEHFHCTPVEYINKHRIERAKQLIKSSLYTNEEIAFLCGFHDVKYFYILFKKVTGHTTKHYKSKS